MTARRRSWFLVCAAFGALLPAFAAGQAYPTKPIRIVVGFAAGGSSDQMARIAGAAIHSGLGQPAIIENRPGAGGNIAAEIVAKAPPDGYALLVTPSAFAVNPSLYRKVPYDAFKDFTPVVQLSSYMLFLVCHPSLPVRSLEELIALGKSRPGQLDYSSAGTGTTTHIAGELLASEVGIKLTHIAFRGTGQQIPALLSGEVALAFGSTTVVPLIEAKRVVLLAVTGAQRFQGFPDVPTIGETVKGFEVLSWNAMFAPAGTPAAIVRQLNQQIAKGLREPAVATLLEKQGLQAGGGSPEALGALVAAEVPRWAKVIRAGNIPLR